MCLLSSSCNDKADLRYRGSGLPVLLRDHRATFSVLESPFTVSNLLPHQIPFLPITQAWSHIRTTHSCPPSSKSISDCPSCSNSVQLKMPKFSWTTEADRTMLLQTITETDVKPMMALWAAIADKLGDVTASAVRYNSEARPTPLMSSCEALHFIAIMIPLDLFSQRLPHSNFATARDSTS